MFDNQVPNVKIVIKYFCFVKVTRYVVYKEDRILLKTTVKKIGVLKLGNLFSQTSDFVPGCQNRLV